MLYKQHSKDIHDNFHRRQIQEALNQQTYEQFRKYAEQQYPGNPEQVRNTINIFCIIKAFNCLLIIREWKPSLLKDDNKNNNNDK